MFIMVTYGIMVSKHLVMELLFTVRLNDDSGNKIGNELAISLAALFCILFTNDWSCS